MLFNKPREEEPSVQSLDKNRVAEVLARSSQVQSQVQSHNACKTQSRSVIDPGLIITGTLEGEGDLQIDGEVRGEIRCAHLTVGSTASVHGTIAAQEVVVRGSVTGVIGANRVVLADGAHVQSDIFHKRLAIEEGAHFEGSSCFHEQPVEKARSKPAEATGASTGRVATEEAVRTTAEPVLRYTPCP